jgi:hypothetical protein
MEQNNIGLRGINAADRDNYIWIEASNFSNWRSFIFISIDLRYSFFYFASLFVYENSVQVFSFEGNQLVDTLERRH